MEQLYALGVSWIQILQDWFKDSQDYFELVNDISNPHHMTEVLFPLVSIVDSVFAAQLLLCMAFGGWLNAVMKWWLLEDRPYWWVQETSFYTGHQRPQLRQFRQTCETGPGCPSGHTTSIAMVLVLALMWISHVMHDRKFYVWWWKYLAYPLFGIVLDSVILARIFVGTHFPHQCLIGAVVGAILAPALCIYVSDPFIWRYGFHANFDTARAVFWHSVCAGLTITIAAVTYLGLVLCGIDPQWTVNLAYRWCENSNDIHVSTTPMYALVQTTAYLTGWALTVTPALAEYRHYTINRSLIISTLATAIVVYSLSEIQGNVCKDNALLYYAIMFFLTAVKPLFLLRVAPALSMWPFEKPKQKAE